MTSGESAGPPGSRRGIRQVKRCAQETITAPGHVLAKTRQQHRYGTPKWLDSYSRRARIEGVFGQLKETGSNQIRRGWTRMMGWSRPRSCSSWSLRPTTSPRSAATPKPPGTASHYLLLADPPFHGFVEITDPEQLVLIDQAVPEPNPPD